MNAIHRSLRWGIVTCACVAAIACSGDADGGNERATDAGKDGSTGPIGSGPPCLSKPSQVVVLGDSFIAGTSPLVPLIEQRATQAGALTSGENYRDYSRAGHALGKWPGHGGIPQQWEDAKAADKDIDFVVMTGGGNDILSSTAFTSPPTNCLNPAADQMDTCKAVLDVALASARDLLVDMRTIGVSDVIFFTYPDFTEFDTNGSLLLDHLVEGVRTHCSEVGSEAYHCHFVDLRAPLAGHPEYFSAFHPTDPGADKIADILWEAMTTHCMAQPARSGCCTP